MDVFMAGSTMRARGTAAGSVGSANKRSTPAQSDWIKRNCGLAPLPRTVAAAKLAALGAGAAMMHKSA